jgi:hypothetical protein
MTAVALHVGPGHAHEHQTHDHHWPAGETPPAGGPVVLDIGLDVGALIVHVSGRWDDLIGHEIHARSVGTSGHGIHTGIWPRSVGGEQALVAVFPELGEGEYELLGFDGNIAATALVSAGSVAELHVALSR